MMSLMLIVLLLVILIIAESKKSSSSSSSSSSSDKTKSQDRINIISDKIKQYGPVISLTESNFSRFIIDRPREYYAALLFTAEAKKYQCTICHTNRIYFQDVAKYYSQEYNFNSTKESQRIAFFTVDVDNARSIFNEMNLESVPRYYVVPPRTIDSPKLKISDFEANVRSGGNDGSAAFIEEIKRLVGVQIKVTWDPKPFKAILIVLSIVLGYIVSAAQVDIKEAIKWYKNRHLWTLFSLLCFGVGVSGSIFCIIRSAPLFGNSRSGGLRIFAGQGRDQYLIEGIIVALWTIGCGLAGVLMYYGTKMPIGFLRNAVVLFSLSVFIVLSLHIWDGYIEKTRWYSLQNTLPGEVMNYFKSNIKKSSGLMKRLIRVSDYWLNEAKDINQVQRKFKSLVLDYIIKTIGFGTKST
jgi:hypothetical protein